MRAHVKDSIALGSAAIFTCPDCDTELSWSDYLLFAGPDVYAASAQVLSKKVTSLNEKPEKSSKSYMAIRSPSGKKEPNSKRPLETSMIRECSTESHLGSLQADLIHLGHLHDAQLTAKTAKKRSKKASSVKTAWSKGTGFGGSRSAVSTSHTAAVKKAEQRQGQADTALVACLTNVIQRVTDAAAFSSAPVDDRTSSMSKTQHAMVLQYIVHTSQLEALLVLLLRNDSLMDLTSTRAELYSTLANVILCLAADPLLCGLLDEGCPIKQAIGHLEGQESKSGDKRKASASIMNDCSDESTSTSVVELLRKLARHCKVFLKQTKGGGVASASVDPLKIVPRLQQLPDKVQDTIVGMPPHIRGTMGRSNTASASRFACATDISSTANDDTATVAPYVEEYLTSMKQLQFRTVTMDYSSHTYSADIYSSANAHTKKDRARRILREIASLSSSLPLGYSASIFVRVDENRPDVLKAMIIGPEGTPYENGCFAFDIFLPLQYPELPPKVTFVTTSHGQVRFNPNLYANGKVCLSLLGTWDGPGWDVKHSTVLQVLLSIQALILCSEPYFNEPGFEARPSARRECIEYNQSLQYQTMEVAMREQLCGRCPEEFVAVVRTHFRLKQKSISEQLERWIDAADKDTTAKPKKSSAAAGYSFPYFHSKEHHQLAHVAKSDLQRAAAKVVKQIGSLSVTEAVIL